MTDSKKEPKRPQCRFRSYALDHQAQYIEEWINENYQNGYVTMEYSVTSDRLLILMIKPGDDCLGLTIPSLIRPI